MPDSAASRARTGARAELQLADVLAVDALAAHVAAVAFMARPASQLLPPAPSPTRVSLLLSLGVLHKRLCCCIKYGTCCRHLCSARTRMREIWHVAGCGAQSGAPSTALAIMLNRFCTVDEPLSSPERSKLVEEGSVGRRARSTRGAGGRQTLPTPWPIGTALAQAPDRSRRRPGAVLHCCTVDILRKACC